MTENEIFLMLVNNPGMAYITPDRKKLYAIASPETGMFVFEADFANMTEDDVNNFIQVTLKETL